MESWLAVSGVFLVVLVLFFLPLFLSGCCFMPLLLLLLCLLFAVLACVLLGFGPSFNTFPFKKKNKSP